jgi:hypothetical protein
MKHQIVALHLYPDELLRKNLGTVFRKGLIHASSNEETFWIISQGGLTYGFVDKESSLVRGG